MGFLRSTPDPQTPMNPITLPIAELKPALAGLSKVLNPKATLPVLHHLKIERTADGWIALTGTDLDRFVTMRLEHPAEGAPLAVLIPYDQLLQITKNCSRDESLHLEATADGPLIKFALADKMGESKVKPLPVAEFPQTPRIKADAIPLPPGLRSSIREAMECASTDSTRYLLNGTFIDASNPKANYIVGTDGRHLYSANSFALPLKHSLIIPSHKFLGWKEFNADGEWQLKADDKHVQLSSRRWRFISRQIEGKYPDWRHPIPNPRDARTHIIMDPAKLETLIRLLQRMPCHDEKHGTIGVEVREGQLFLLGKAAHAEPWLRVPVPDSKAQGPQVTTFLDRQYLTKALQFGLNSIDLNDELSPLRFHCQGKQLIVMPLRERAERAPSVPPPPARPPTPEPPPERKPMPTSEPPPPPSNGSKSAIEEAIDLTNALRDRFQDGVTQMKDLSLKLKLINREQRTSHREFDNVRSTLRSLQSLKL
jgi:DNA polymerase III sliding clamp (beta) subunit (PCNA family)